MDKLSIKDIQNKIQKGEYRFSDHAVNRMIKRGIARYEIESVIIKGEIIEEYPDDKYSPSCLIYGKTDMGRNLHVQVSLSPNIVIITTYEPNINEWIDYKIRR